MKPDLAAYDRWGLASSWGDVIRRHNERRATERETPPTPREGRGVSRSRASLPQPQVQSNGGRAAAAD